MAVAFELAGPGSPLPSRPNSEGLVQVPEARKFKGQMFVGRASRPLFAHLATPHHWTSHREWISPDWILTSVLEEASDWILTEAQAEDPWLFGRFDEPPRRCSRTACLDEVPHFCQFG